MQVLTMVGDITPQARQVFEKAYPGRAWPEGWRVKWKMAKSERVFGTCAFGEKVIYLSHHMAVKHGRCVQTLLHEFVHMLNPNLKHGQRFDELERANLRMIFGWDHKHVTMRSKRIENNRLRRRGPVRIVGLGAAAEEEMELRPLSEVLAGIGKEERR